MGLNDIIITKYFQIIQNKDGSYYYWFVCPGCRSRHPIKVGGENSWLFDGNFNQPTFEPSVRTLKGTRIYCTVFIDGGKLRYTNDCVHELKNQTIPMLLI